MSSEDLESESGESQDPSADLDLGQGETEYVVAEPKKPLSAATLILFAVFGAAGLGSYFLLVKQGPSASAATSADPKADQVIGQFMTDSSVARAASFGAAAQSSFRLYIRNSGSCSMNGSTNTDQL